MADLVLYLGITAVGYVLGWCLRSHKEKLSWTGVVQTVAITILVLLMGMRMGANREITDNLSTIGLSAFFMTVMVIVFSVLAIFFTRKILKIDRYGQLEKLAQPEAGHGPYDETNSKGATEAKEIAGDGEATQVAETLTRAPEEEKKQGVNTMTVMILISVIIGMAVGYLGIREIFASNMEDFDSAAGLGIKIGLCLLLIFVGIDLGLEGTVMQNFKAVGFRILAFPVAVVVGTLTASFICSFFLDLSIRESMAIGAGFGWYTLAPGIIMEAGHMTASAVCFLHNVMREFFAILLIPVVAKKIGYVETVAMPGAAAMDVCLPIVEKSTRSEIAVYSFISGALLSILVPVLVPIIIG